MPSPLISIGEAIECLLASATPLSDIETVMLGDAYGRVLAADQVSPISVPPANNSAMDGYALSFADIAAGKRGFPISQRIPAGTAAEPQQPRTAARVFTGAEMPAGADVVIMQEDCSADGGEVKVRKAPTSAGGTCASARAGYSGRHHSSQCRNTTRRGAAGFTGISWAM